MSVSTSSKTETVFERGFKAWCDNISLSFRDRLNIPKYEPLPSLTLADYLGVRIWTPIQVPNIPSTTRDYLSSPEQSNEWSAATVIVKDMKVIIINPNHSAGRQSSDIMHELAHIIRKHESQNIIASETGFMLRTFNSMQEEEADWLAGSLLLPRIALINIVKRWSNPSDACQNYGVSNQLLTYRLNMSGVKKQFSLKKKY